MVAPRRRRRWPWIASAIALALAASPVGIAWARVWLDDDTPSRSIGTTSRGRVEHAHPIPPSGAGYTTYSWLGAAAGRQYVHGTVRDALVESFAQMARRHADRTFVVAETGGPSGGPFPPHRTHENGTSADVLVPLVDAGGAPSNVPTWPWNRFGYDVEIDGQGRVGEERIDFDALAEWLALLDAAARDRGAPIDRVIVAPEYVPPILAAPHGAALGALGRRISRTQAWVRHDEHAHVDFALAAAHE